MNWLETSFEVVCVETAQLDPGLKPDSEFRYIDIAAVDKDKKQIVSTQSLLGVDAPSRARKQIKAQDVLVSTVRPNLNAVALVPQELDGEIASTGFCVLRANENLIDPRWIYYRCLTPDFVECMVSQMRGASYPAVSDRVVKKARTPLPPRREQRRIVELLEHADCLRRKREDADKLAARILPSLFLKMFGDPVRNTSGWKTENLLKICSPRQWPTISSRELLPSGFPVYGANGRIGFYSSFNHEKPTVLITCRGATCGTINVCEPNSYVTGNAMALDEPDERKTTNEFLEWFLRVRGLSDTITGAAQPQITRANLAVVEVATPPKDLVDTFTQKAQAVSDLESKLVNSRTNIGTLFQTMLHRAFSGELTAGWRQAHMKELLAEMELQSKALDKLEEAA